MVGMRQLLCPIFMALRLFPCTMSITVTTNMPKVEVHENMNAVLSCEFQTEKDTNPRIEWKKKGKNVSFIYFDGEFIGSFKGRAKMDRATVTLHDVTVKDSGIYHCEVTARHDKICLGEVAISLSVLELAQAPSCQVPETALSGSAVELRCQDELSAPSAVYSWFKDNKLLSSAQLPGAGYSLDPKTGTLKFKSVSATDAGQYRCEASSGTGAPKSCAAQHLKIIEFDLTLVVAVGVGVALFLLSCSLAIHLCCCQDCCSRCHIKNKGKQKRNINKHRPPPDLSHYKHTRSFVI
ncbi:junctional adhesion molecule 2b [Electrophorus electricus]|uniref:junctional adhesion molecule 2b n=1 Tax=Electrophorus electricus TaxID=8005 RepID=UPI0015D07FBF|nr:junctional adhesion molecule 2b [Electrophorus electricus]